MLFMLTKNHYPRRWYWTLTGVCAVLLTSSIALAEPPSLFAAEYGVYRNGKRIGKTAIELEQTSETHYRYTRRSKGVKGLARLLRIAESETAEFELIDGGFRPLSYQASNKVAGRKRGWQAVYDWQQNTISGVDDGEQFQLDAEPGLQDPVSLQFTLIEALRNNRHQHEFRVLDGAAIEDRQFSSEAVTGYTTALGCTDTVRVDRIRANSRRYTTAWHAPAAAYTVVRLDHGKRGDDSNSMRLEHLSIDGEVITFDDECADPRED